MHVTLCDCDYFWHYLSSIKKWFRLARFDLLGRITRVLLFLPLQAPKENFFVHVKDAKSFGVTFLHLDFLDISIILELEWTESWVLSDYYNQRNSSLTFLPTKQVSFFYQKKQTIEMFLLFLAFFNVWEIDRNEWMKRTKSKKAKNTT